MKQICNAGKTLFFALKFFLRRCSWLAVKVSCVIIECFLFSAHLFPSNYRAYLHCNYKLILVNVGDDAWKPWIDFQKNVTFAAIRIMTHSEIHQELRNAFANVKKIHVVRGRSRHSVLLHSVFLYLGPPSGKTGECVRCMLNDIIWLQKRRDAYFKNCLSATASSNIATQYTRDFLAQNDALIEHETIYIYKCGYTESLIKD